MGLLTCFQLTQLSQSSSAGYHSCYCICVYPLGQVQTDRQGSGWLLFMPFFLCDMTNSLPQSLWSSEILLYTYKTKTTFQDIMHKMVENRNIIPDFPSGDAVATFQLINHPWLSSDSLIKTVNLSALMCVSCKEGNSIMNWGHLPDCILLNSENTQLLVKLYWDDRRQMEFPSTWALNTTILLE
jgi:hypothetical protein